MLDKFCQSRVWFTTQSNQTFANFIQSCIQSFHVFIHFWMPNHETSTTHIPVNLVKSNMSSIKICHHLVQYSLSFWQRVLVYKSCYISCSSIFYLSHILTSLILFIIILIFLDYGLIIMLLNKKVKTKDSKKDFIRKVAKFQNFSV